MNLKMSIKGIESSAIGISLYFSSQQAFGLFLFLNLCKMVRVAILVLTVCVAAMAAPQGPEARLIRQRNENDGLGEYRNT